MCVGPSSCIIGSVQFMTGWHTSCLKQSLVSLGLALCMLVTICNCCLAILCCTEVRRDLIYKYQPIILLDRLVFVPVTWRAGKIISQMTYNVSSGTLYLSPHKAEKLASPTVTNSIRPKYRPAGLWFILVKMKYRLGNLKKTVTNNVVSGNSGSGDPKLWELRGERVKRCALDSTKPATCCQFQATQ